MVRLVEKRDLARFVKKIREESDVGAHRVAAINILHAYAVQDIELPEIEDDEVDEIWEQRPMDYDFEQQLKE